MDVSTYQVWRHQSEKEWWVIRIEYQTLTGAAGPYPPNAPLGELADLLYEDHPDDLEWFIRDQESFEVVKS